MTVSESFRRNIFIDTVVGGFIIESNEITLFLCLTFHTKQVWGQPKREVCFYWVLFRYWHLLLKTIRKIIVICLCRSGRLSKMLFRWQEDTAPRNFMHSLVLTREPYGRFNGRDSWGYHLGIKCFLDCRHLVIRLFLPWGMGTPRPSYSARYP